MAAGESRDKLEDLRRCPCHEWPCSMNDIDRFHDEYRIEVHRRSSFSLSERGTVWPHHRTYHGPHSRENDPYFLMARAGFFYTGYSDLVRCFECCVLIDGWKLLGQELSDIIAVHGNRSNECRYLRGLPCGNVITLADLLLNIPMLRTHEGVMAMYGDVVRANRILPSSRHVSCNLDSSDSTEVANDVTASQYPQFDSYDNRMRSFNTWPITKIQTKEAMSYAGFYYTGKDDKTQCYHCGLELCEWQPEDDPLLQHIKHFANCTHIIKVLQKELSTNTARM